jgi:hypothetical protein
LALVPVSLMLESFWLDPAELESAAVDPAELDPVVL